MSYSSKPMRRSSLLGPWGVGAIVPFPGDETLMIAGLDKWRYNDVSDFLIEDERLQKRLGVRELRWPPDFRERNADPENCNLTIPAVRFPRWHYCPFCGTMRKTTYYEKQQPVCDSYQWPNGRKCTPNSRFKRRMIPERFVVVCSEGHIDDFPVAEWLHQGSSNEYNPATCHIRRSTGGASSSLTGVFYECKCGAKRSLANALNKGSLDRIGYKCKGSKPWLGMDEDPHDPCPANSVSVILRGATNVWFSDTRSSIYIPSDSDLMKKKFIAILDKYYDALKSKRIDGEIDRTFIDFIAQTEHVNSDELYQAFVKRFENMDRLGEVTEDMSEDQYRLAEYDVLTKSSGSDNGKFHSINYPITTYDPIISRFFKSISLVPKLRETRAFVGFSRLEPKLTSISELKKMLRLGSGNWLPAIEVYGEGIFFEFNADTLHEWSMIPSVIKRVNQIGRSYQQSTFGKNNEGSLKPEFILIHTFAHLLINQLSFECGYGSSSIRERIYCE